MIIELFLYTIILSLVKDNILAIRATETPNKLSSLCEYGPVYSKDSGCNKCICNENTGVYSCTLRNCKKRTIVGECRVGHTYSLDEGCNTCICTKEFNVTAQYFCTMVDSCNKIPKKILKSTPTDKPKIENPQKIDRCPYGHLYSKDNFCNKCTCNPSNGKTKCTKKGCFKCDFYGKHCKDKNVACQIGQEYTPDGGCNRCVCLPEFRGNGSYYCTLGKTCAKELPALVIKLTSSL